MELSLSRGRVVKAGRSNSYYREVRGSIPGGQPALRTLLVPLYPGLEPYTLNSEPSSVDWLRTRQFLLNKLNHSVDLGR